MIQFVDDSPSVALSDAIGDYQLLTGRTLGAADGEMLVINAFAYRMSLLRAQLNVTGNQCLISDATGAALDQLGIKNGTFRLEASAAVVTMEFTIAGGAPTLTLPAGMRVRSNDGAVIFAVDVDTVVVTGTGTVDVDCTALVTGVVGNGYLAGFITTIVDPQAYVTGATNTDTSEGGSDVETDGAYRARIPLANASFSVAGPEDAYAFFARSASASIADVSVTSGAVAGGIATSSLGSGGSGYAVNDLFNVSGGSTLATGQVLSVATGVVVTYVILTKGLGNSVASGVATVATSGAGTGLTINVLTLVSLMVVTVYPLLNDGSVSTPVNNLVLAALDDKKVRPLNDFVRVISPTAIDYSLNPVLKLYKNAPPAAGIVAAVTARLVAMTNQWTKALNYDLVLNQFIGACMVPGVYTIVSMSSFTADVPVDAEHYGFCTGISVTVDGTVEDETY